ncbi:hypothetical protein ANO11243_068740 [Dothideomycetidae sp. 11243]|nr:hypothetical protein ANO11243_068740 [fungal sp. No.11243]
MTPNAIEHHVAQIRDAMGVPRDDPGSSKRRQKKITMRLDQAGQTENPSATTTAVSKMQLNPRRFGSAKDKVVMEESIARAVRMAAGLPTLPRLEPILTKCPPCINPHQSPPPALSDLGVNNPMANMSPVPVTSALDSHEAFASHLDTAIPADINAVSCFDADDPTFDDFWELNPQDTYRYDTPMRESVYFTKAPEQGESDFLNLATNIIGSSSPSGSATAMTQVGARSVCESPPSTRKFFSSTGSEPRTVCPFTSRGVFQSWFGEALIDVKRHAHDRGYLSPYQTSAMDEMITTMNLPQVCG